MQMMRHHGVIILASLFALIASSAFAGEDRYSSRYWRGMCASFIEDKTLNHSNHDRCFGFLLGATQAEMYFDVNHKAVTYCAPKGSTFEQYARIWISFLDKNPKELHKLAFLTFMWAMEEAFPCPKK